MCLFYFSNEINHFDRKIANTKGAEILYKKISDLCELDENTVLLDICCGTGTIGLTLAKVANIK
jgi:tRNA/tmRNA/rRNA uracil-C5-methylase (TrmA/RlmC/RlmD family)